jgi:ATP-binding cassette subfamily B protein
VFDQGHLVERGRHAELLALQGVYAKLWQKQAGFAPDQDGLSSRLDAAKLGQLPILQLLSDELQQAAAQMFISEHHPANRLVIQEGDEADRFYLVVRGRVEVLVRSPDGKDQQVRVLEDGDYFGEVGLLFNVPRSASVRTLLPTLFLTLTRPQFLDLLDRVPDLKKKIIDFANARYRSMPAPAPGQPATP